MKTHSSIHDEIRGEQRCIIIIHVYAMECKRVSIE